MKIYTEPKTSDIEMLSNCGSFFSFTSNWQYISSIEDTYIYDSYSSNIIVSIHKNSISPELKDIATNNFLTIAKNNASTNRGAAAGSHVRYNINNKFERSASVNSSIIGYFDSTNGKRPCRLTNLTNQYFENYSKGLPFVIRMNELFNKYYPLNYFKQYNAASNSGFNIESTAFSTLTVNYNFRTALHIDKGDFKEGFGNLVVCSKNITGGELLFPKYQLAINIENGDFVAMDVHQYHCNNEIQYINDEAYRLSFVSYFRSSLSKCQRKNKFHQEITNMDTEFLISEIFRFIGKSVPEKKEIGVSKNGQIWWERVDDRFCLIYKGRQYILYDRVANKKIMSLQPAYLYAKHLVITSNF